MNEIKYLVLSMTWKLSHENVLTDSCKSYLILNGMNMGERLAILRPFNSIPVISGRFEGDNEHCVQWNLFYGRRDSASSPGR